MTTATLTLTQFLLARIAADEAAAREAITLIGRWNKARVLAECEAKRRIVERYPNASPNGDDWAEVAWNVLCWLATVYAEDPDYREDWRL